MAKKQRPRPKEARNLVSKRYLTRRVCRKGALPTQGGKNRKTLWRAGKKTHQKNGKRNGQRKRSAKRPWHTDFNRVRDKGDGKERIGRSGGSP